MYAQQSRPLREQPMTAGEIEKSIRVAALASQQPQPRDVSEVERELNELACANDELHCVISRLIERLAPVTTPSPDAASGNSCEPCPGSPVGSMVHTQRLQVQRAVRRIHEAIEVLAI